jgi:hypothetical protein
VVLGTSKQKLSVVVDVQPLIASEVSAKDQE